MINLNWGSITFSSTFIAGILTSPLLWASEQPDKELNLFNMSLSDLMDITVSGATLTSESLYSTPAAVTVFSRDQIQRMGISALYELMNLAPGFQVSRSGSNSGYGSASSRGRRIGPASAEVLLIVDGQRTTTQRTGGIIDFLEMPVIGIERIEFIRGPGSALYGSNAMMGVVNIITVSGVNEVNIAAGNFGQKSSNFLYGNTLGDIALDSRITYSSSKGQPYSLPDTFSDTTLNTKDPEQRLDVNIKAEWGKTQLLVNYGNNSADHFYITEGLDPEYNQFSSSNHSIALHQDFDNGRLSSEGWISYSTITESLKPKITAEDSLFPISQPNSSAPLLADVEFKSKEFRLKLHNNFQISDTQQMLFGAEWRQITIDEGLAYSNYDVEALVARNYPIAYYGDQFQPTTILLPSKEDVIGLYGQYLSRPWENTRLILGLRFDHYSELNDSQLNPRLAIVQTLSKQHTLKLLYGDAFRAPTPAETGLVNNPSTRGNPNLEAETVHSWDAIWLAHYENVSWTIGYFEHRFENSILQVLSDNEDISKEYTNAHQGPIKGGELEVSVQLTSSWIAQANYTHIFDSPEISYRESKEFGSLMINYQQGKWNANLAIAYRGERMGPDKKTPTTKKRAFDAYWMSYGKVQYSASERWQFFLQGNNLSDEYYSFPMQGDLEPEGIPSRGRELLLGVKLFY